LVADGTLESNLPILQALYRERRDTMLDSLQTHLGEIGHWNRPDGGLFVWLTLPEVIDTAPLLADCLEQKSPMCPATLIDQRPQQCAPPEFLVYGARPDREGVQRLAASSSIGLSRCRARRAKFAYFAC